MGIISVILIIIMLVIDLIFFTFDAERMMSTITFTMKCFVMISPIALLCILNGIFCKEKDKSFGHHIMFSILKWFLASVCVSCVWHAVLELKSAPLRYTNLHAVLQCIFRGRYASDIFFARYIVEHVMVAIFGTLLLVLIYAIIYGIRILANNYKKSITIHPENIIRKLFQCLTKQNTKGLKMSDQTNECQRTAFEYLTTMPFDELKKLRIASGNFISMAVLLIIYIPLLLVQNGIALVTLLYIWNAVSLIVFFFALRSRFAKIIFWIICCTTIIGCLIIMVATPVKSLLGIAVWSLLAKSAIRPELWGGKSLTHSQIVFAYKKRKKNLPFSENELPPRDVIDENADKVLAFLTLIASLTSIIAPCLF